MMPSLSRGAPHRHHQLHSGTRRRELMFDWEWSSPNEPQAEVRRGAPVALLSDYRPQTHLPALTYQVVGSGVYVPPPLPLRAEGKYHHLASQRHTRSERAASVMRSGEIKVREAAALRSEGPGRRQQRGAAEAKRAAAADFLRLPGDS